jgi:hypothetical protein
VKAGRGATRTALVVGLATLLVAAGVLTLLGRGNGPPDLPASDRAEEIVATFESGDHVWVSDDARDVVSPSEERELERLAAASEPEVYVVVAHDTYQDGTDGVVPTAEAVWWHLDEETVHAWWSAPGDIHVETGEQHLEGYPSFETFGDPARRLSELVATVDDDRLVDGDDGLGWWQAAFLGALGGGVLWLLVPLPLLLVIRNRRRT